MPFYFSLADMLLGGVSACIILGCNALNVTAPPPSPSGGTGREFSIPVGAYNQCETSVSANGRSFQVLLDSGASGNLTFGKNHAKSLGFDPDSLSYNSTFESANGQGRLAHVKLREVKIGNWTLRDVPAEITQATQSQPLLGLEILHVLNFHLRDGYCHLQIPASTRAASVRPSPPLRTDIERAPAKQRELTAEERAARRLWCTMEAHIRASTVPLPEKCREYLASR